MKAFKRSVFRDVTPSCLLQMYRSFGGTCSLHVYNVFSKLKQ